MQCRPDPSCRCPASPCRPVCRFFSATAICPAEVLKCRLQVNRGVGCSPNPPAAPTAAAAVGPAPRRPGLVSTTAELWRTEVRQLRHHFGPFLARFSAPHHPARAAGHEPPLNLVPTLIGRRLMLGTQ